MTGTQTPPRPRDLEDDRLIRRTGLRGGVQTMLARARSGDLGSLPVLIGLLLIFVIFQSLNEYFLSSANLVDLATDIAAVGTIALGVVVVLLVAQIDLSVGSMSGVASSILGVMLVERDWPLAAAILLALAAGIAVGALYGWIFIAFSVPSFVITLAGLLGLLGLQLKLLGNNGSINIPFTSPIVHFSQQTYVARPLSYVFAAVVAGGYFALALARTRRRRRANLSTGSLSAEIGKSVALLVVLEFGCWYLNRDRGISAPFVLFVVLVGILHVALTRTAWGRAVFAVGGSVEAARRAGINVRRVFMTVFILGTVLAALGGLLSAGRLATASISAGTGATNLNAIAAAVIGGTSLFGGRGSAKSALLGMLVIQSIASGLTLMNLDSSVRYMVTGAVLMIAVTVDSVARRTREAHGQA